MRLNLRFVFVNFVTKKDNIIYFEFILTLFFFLKTVVKCDSSNSVILYQNR